MVKKEGRLVLIAICFMIVILTTISVQAGFFDWIKETITGKASSNQPTNISITVTGTTAAQIRAVSSIAATDPVESNLRSILFYVTAYDADGVNDLNDTSVQANFSAGATKRENLSCKWLNDIDTTSANYSCTIAMWYWDANGAWNVTVRGTDLGNTTWAYNLSTNFTYNQMKGMVISPNSLTWPGVSPGATNQTSDNDPTTINNTGNYNGTITINAINLLGESDTSKIIYAANLSVGNATAASNPECNSTALTNSTAISILNSNSNPGNLSAGGGAAQEQFYYCIPVVPPGLSSQAYSTLNGGSWTISY